MDMYNQAFDIKAVTAELNQLDRLINNLNNLLSHIGNKKNCTAINNIVNLKEYYIDQSNKLLIYLNDIKMSINKLDGIAKDVFTYRYIDGLTWDKIEEKTHYSNAQLHRIHRKYLGCVRL